jgi:hypothetical protein
MLRRRFISSFFRPRAGSLAYAAAPRRSPALVLSTFNHDMKRFSASSARTHETEEEEEYFEEDEPLVETEWHLVYEGAMARPLKRIKMVSLTSCTLSIISMPLLAVFGNQDVSLAGRVAVAFTAGCFGVGTTAFVHFIGKTYISELWKKIELPDDVDSLEDAEEDEVTTMLRAETFNLFSQKVVTEFDVNDVLEGDPRPFCSFKVQDRNFFLHHEPECWIDGEEGVIDDLFTRPIDTSEGQAPLK